MFFVGGYLLLLAGAACYLRCSYYGQVVLHDYPGPLGGRPRRGASAPAARLHRAGLTNTEVGDDDESVRQCYHTRLD